MTSMNATSAPPIVRASRQRSVVSLHVGRLFLSVNTTPHALFCVAKHLPLRERGASFLAWWLAMDCALLLTMWIAFQLQGTGALPEPQRLRGRL